MEKELVELFETVKKAADVAAADGGANMSPEEDRCLDALKRLQEFPVSYQVLVSTQIGRRLRQLTKHPRKRIQVLASDVVEMWKTIIFEETVKNKKNGITKADGSVKAEPAASNSGEANKDQRVNSINVEHSVKAESDGLHSNGSKKFQRVSSMKVEKVVNSEASMTQIKAEKVDVRAGKIASGERIKVENIAKEEKSSSEIRRPAPVSGHPKMTSVPLCKDQMRDKVRELLAEAFCKVANEVNTDLRQEIDECDPFRVALLVESALFDKWGRSNGKEKQKYRSIMFNIKDPNNPDFRRKVLLGQFPPHSMTNLTADDMASDERQRQNEKIKEKALFDCERAGAAKASTNAFKCGRCGKRETTYYQLQTRSADEPMTTFVTCVNCNNHWKFC